MVAGALLNELEVMMKIYDSHTHLNSSEFINDVPKFIKQARELDVVEMTIVGSNTEMNAQAVALAHQ